MNSIALLFTDVVRFFSEQQFEGGCPVCASTKWSISSAPDSDNVLIMAQPIHESTQVFLNVQVTCNQCGWVRLHNANLINKWVQENPAAIAAKPAESSGEGAEQEGAQDE